MHFLTYLCYLSCALLQICTFQFPRHFVMSMLCSERIVAKLLSSVAQSRYRESDRGEPVNSLETHIP